MTQGSETTRPGRQALGSVLRRFEQWAHDAPGARALVAGPDTLTYGQLDARSNQLAHHLLAAGLPDQALVAVGTARQQELVVALLAVLKAGAAYALIDVADPRTGQRQLAAIRPDAVLTHAAHHPRLDDGRGLRFIRLGAEASAIAGRPTDRPTPATRDRGTAALLFTGAADPRPVPVSHPLLLAACDSWAEVAAPGPADRHLITAGPDATAFAAGWPRALCTGGALVLTERTPWSPDGIRAAVDADDVTVLHTDPAGALRLLLGDRPQPDREAAVVRPAPGTAARSLRMVTVTGDRLYLDQHAALQARLRPGARVLALYGTAESAGTGTWFELSRLPAPPAAPARLALIGVPFPGCRADLRDGQILLTPPDGGEAIPTGDLGLLGPDGLLEFRGRIRDRITGHGPHLDPHHLESLIRSHDGVGSALVADVRDGGSADGGPGKRPRAGSRGIVAYLAPPPAGAPPGAGLPDAVALRAHLADEVPPEHLPYTVVPLRALPRDRTGREDRAGLPLPPLPDGPARTARGAGKYAGGGGEQLSPAFASGCAVLVLALFALALTGVFWPGSTDLSGVPSPWAALFFVLYVFEALAFAAGVVFLFGGRSRMRGRSRALTRAAHLAVVYLLVAWWPQDNLYRLAAKHDWPRQAALVYTFNIPLMIAGAVVALYLTRKPASPFGDD
ncbi:MULTISPECIES: AMP-binding protein [unclassified Streptomyces]|uniref:AMP-binding protein n=1 Tax=unclassified Streptomyces TaxID=2593676 RepID=UPI002E2F4F7E|nr:MULTISPECIES: AMP-binding protein [unclassified Streptomyces]WUC63406.1 AMP-binding protein [Streptomyces sp. NBC_00539]